MSEISPNSGKDPDQLTTESEILEPEILEPEILEPELPENAYDDIPTEWFSDQTEGQEHVGLESLSDIAVERITRNHFVTTVLVSHNGDVWLPAVLTQLARTTRPPEVIVGVDAASADQSRAMLTEALGSDRVVELGTNPGFGAAVAAGLVTVPRPSLPEGHVEWVWLLHDDGAPDAHCLERLLATADDNPSAAILGPKILGWHDRRLLLEAGVAITADGRRVTGLERREHDQGQHDGTRDVLAVSSAGMLVRRDVWDALEGFDPALPLFRDDLDFCWRAHRMGERVLIATDALMHHREASAHGRRGDGNVDLLARDREAAVHVLLSHSTGLRAVLLAARLYLGSAIRALVYSLGKDFVAARGELSAVLSVLRHPGRIRQSRTLIARSATEPASVVNHLRPSTFDQIRSLLETATGLATTSNSTVTPLSALDSGPVDDDAAFLDQTSVGFIRRVMRKPSVLTILVLTIIAVVATRSLWLGQGIIQGGALLPSPWGASDLWQTYTEAWHNVGPGSTADSPTYLLFLAILATVLLGKATWAVQFVILLAIPLAGWAAYFASRGLIHGKGLRVWGAVTYALVPAMTGALAQGRMGTSVLAIALPFTIRSLYRLCQPGATVRRSAGTALLLAVVLSFAPGVWLIAFVAIIIVLLAVRKLMSTNIRPLAFAFGASFMVLMPWSFTLVREPVRFLLEPGLQSAYLTDPNISMTDILLLHPGGPGMSPLIITVGLVFAALMALLRSDRRNVVVMWWVLVAIAAVFALIQVMIPVTPPGQTVAIRTWAGPATLVMSIALIAAAALGAQGLRTRFVGQSFSLGQPVAAIAVIGAFLVPVVSALWLLPANDTTLFRGSSTTVPAFVAADSRSPQAPRTLVLSDDKSGRVTYTLLNGAGLTLGDADVPPPAQVWEAIDPYVASMASGRGGDEIAVLAGYGVRYVLLAQSSSEDIIPILDAEPGLRRLSNADGEVLWRVAGVTSRARISDGDTQSPVGIAQPGDVGVSPYIDQTLPDGSGTRVLYIGASADSRWKAGELKQVTTESPLNWSATFAIPQGSPMVVVEFDGSVRGYFLLAQLLIVLGLVITALPSRKHVDIDADAEALAALEARIQ